MGDFSSTDGSEPGWRRGVIRLKEFNFTEINFFTLLLGLTHNVNGGECDLFADLRQPWLQAISSCL